jgi:hypothetical protein
MCLVFITVSPNLKRNMFCFVLLLHECSVKTKPKRVPSSRQVTRLQRNPLQGFISFACDTDVIAETHRRNFATADIPSSYDVTVSALYLYQCSWSSVNLASLQWKVLTVVIIYRSTTRFNLLKFYVLPTQSVCVYCAVRTESLNINQVYFRL